MELKQAGTRWDAENTIDRGVDIPELNFNLVKQCDTLKYPDLMSFYNTDQLRGKAGAFSTVTVGVFSIDIHTQFVDFVYWHHFSGE